MNNWKKGKILLQTINTNEVSYGEDYKFYDIKLIKSVFIDLKRSTFLRQIFVILQYMINLENI